MSDALIDKLRALAGGPRDGALLRFSLANVLLASGDTEAACAEYRQAVTFDPDYSAAWEQLGKAEQATGRNEEAATAWRHGIAVADRRGDRQAAREMRVFLRRVENSDQ